MRLKLAAALVAGFVLAVVVIQIGTTSHAQGQDEPAKQRVEYKVVFAHVEHIEVRESRRVDGKVKEIVHGPKASAAAMTEQFNALAAEGREYVGPVATTGRPAPGTERGIVPADVPGDPATGVLVVFRRQRP